MTILKKELIWLKRYLWRSKMMSFAIFWVLNGAYADLLNADIGITLIVTCPVFVGVGLFFSRRREFAEIDQETGSN